MKATIEVRLPQGRSYPILVGPGTWEELPRLLARRPPSGVVLVSERRVHDLYGGRILALLARWGADPHLFLLPEGERSKSFAQLSRLCRFLAARRLDRGALLLALGGGAVGDLAGLASALYLRGIRLIHLPTSLLAMVDSSVGGKTAINIPEGKNLVGTIFQPEAVLADTAALPTLPSREWYSGMAEAVKMAITLDPALFRHLSEEGIGPGEPDPVRVIEASCRRKAEVVEADEKEGGWRRVLNFGHTLGHALEAGEGYGRLRHGEAVVLGMGAALVLSRRLGHLPEADFIRARDLLSRFPLPRLTGGRDLAGFLARDKKSLGGKVTAVLLSAIGQPLFILLPDPSLLVGALAEWRRGLPG